MKAEPWKRGFHNRAAQQRDVLQDTSRGCCSVTKPQPTGCLCSPILCRVPGLRVAWTSHPMDGSTAEPLDSAHTSAFGPLVRGFSPKEMKNSRSVIEVCGERGLPGTGTSWPWPPTPAGADGALQGPAPAHQSCIDLQAAFCNSEHKGKGWEPTERSGSVGVVPQRDTSPGTRGCAAGPGGMGAAPPC